MTNPSLAAATIAATGNTICGCRHRRADHTRSRGACLVCLGEGRSCSRFRYPEHRRGAIIYDTPGGAR